MLDNWFIPFAFLTGGIWSGLAALAVGVIVAWFSGNLFLVAASGCFIVFLVELLL